MNKPKQNQNNKTDENSKDIDNFPYDEFPKEEIIYECIPCGNIQDFGGVCQQCGSIVIDQKFFS